MEKGEIEHTDLFLSFENVQPPVSHRFPCFWRFIVFEHYSS